MKNYFILFLFVISCKNYDEQKKDNSFTVGKGNVLVDDTFLPIIEEQKAVFESQYPKAFITLNPKPESEIVNDIIEKKAITAIVADNNLLFKNKPNGAIFTPIAVDAVALIANSTSTIKQIDIETILSIFQGKSDKQIVFDNANSSTFRYILEKLKITKYANNNIKALNNNTEVIKFVAENKNSIGIVGANWLLFPNPELEQDLNNVSVLAVKNDKNVYVKPTQSNIADASYPFSRKLFFINFQGKKGLGMGFATFIAGEVGQRIILKSGIVPVEIPPRKIRIRNKI